MDLLASAATSGSTEVAKEPPKSNRGTGFTLVEDLLLCKAFIAASEDPIRGVSQKGAVFKAMMHEHYKTLLHEQENLDKITYQGSSSTTHTFLEETQPPTIYSRHTPDSCFTRFKSTVSH
jgi:hypothetical protein